ncbi:NnrU family protein [Hydrogenophaga sp. PAMC20947]|uniref:NnrU family protein n=1 Tax=Hydrogenophaga sp. PAMC20947 TaxID=2565558 RepID=UPI00109DDF7C|nr:NnrU family protein [Hydrogenophaga sp. PAMC20947]QCB46616.1 NnrU family protein [Hydrogenophaga sp. PAMC20947]
MAILILGLVLFLGIHCVSIVSPDGRDRLAKRMGEMAYKGVYSLVALAGFVLIVWGYGLSREAPVMLYAMPGGFRHLAALLMLPVFVLLFAAYLPGRIQRAAKHPMLLAVKLWALAHLLAQSVTGGSLADVLLFGGFLVWAVADRISLKRRAAAGGLRAVPALPASGFNDAIAVVGGLAVYVAIVLWLHAAWFGVRPFG